MISDMLMLDMLDFNVEFGLFEKKTLNTILYKIYGLFVLSRGHFQSVTRYKWVKIWLQEWNCAN